MTEQFVECDVWAIATRQETGSKIRYDETQMKFTAKMKNEFLIFRKNHFDKACRAFPDWDVVTYFSCQ